MCLEEEDSSRLEAHKGRGASSGDSGQDWRPSVHPAHGDFVVWGVGPAGPAQWTFPISLPSTKACCSGSSESGYRPSSLLRVINVICLISRVVLFQSLKGCGGGKGARLLTLKSRMKGLSMKTKPKKEIQLESSFPHQKRTNGSIYGRFTCFWSEGVFVITVANNIILVYIYLCTSCLFFKRI